MNDQPQDNPNNPSLNTVTESPRSVAWEREVLEKLAFAALREQRLARRWSIFFKLFTLSVIVLVFFLVSDFRRTHGEGEITGRHTAVINLQGVIDSDSDSSAEKMVAALQQAFKDKDAVGIILRINSPGGSPVQAGMINDEILRLRKQYPEKHLYAVVEELCASGGYYVAVAAEKIYVNKASFIGSIGVLMDGFGFTGTMEKLGVERRLLTAGENKGFLDPFSPLSPGQRAHADTMLKEVHQQFIDVVKRGRGVRLKPTPEIFSGLVWTGARSIELGLADDLGTVDSVARDVIKAEELVDYSVKENFAERVAKRLGSAFGAGTAKTLASTFFKTAMH